MSLLETLTPIWNAAKKIPAANHIVSERGKIYYVGRGGFIYVENEDTANLPEFSISKENLNTLMEWLFFDEAVTVTKTSKNIVFSNSERACAIPLTDDQSKEGIDEVVLKPLLTNQFHFTVGAPAWRSAVDSLCTAATDTPIIPVSTVQIAGNAALFDYLNPATGVTVKSVLITGETVFGFQSWNNSYSLECLGLTTPYPEDVRVSFTQNTNKQRSSLMVQYHNGVTLIALPLWK